MLDHRVLGEDRKGQEQAGPEPLPEIGHHMAVIVPGMTPVTIMTGMVRGRRRAMITMGGTIMGGMFVLVVILVDVLICCPFHGSMPLFFVRARKTGERAI